MSYTITTTAGVTLATIADGTINQTATSISFIGKNYPGYGALLNENFVALLENFNRSTPPANAITGQLWYDSGNGVLKVRNNSAWKAMATTVVSSSTPDPGAAGDLWWDTVASQLKVWNGGAWTVVGPTYTASTGITGAIPETILDSGSAPHIVISLYVANQIVAILSRDPTYTPLFPPAGFPLIRPGLTIISSGTLPGSQFTGDVSNALSLNGFSSGQFLRSDQNTSTNYSLTAAGGFKIGTELALTVTGSTSQLRNSVVNHDLDFYISKGGVDTKAIGITGTTGLVSISNSLSVTGAATIGGTLAVTGNITASTARISSALLPASNNTGQLGGVGAVFNSVHATSFVGTSLTLSAPLPVASGGTGSATATGTGQLVLATNPELSDGAKVGGVAIGYRTIPQNPQGGTYTLNTSDSGKHIYYTGGASTLTVPDNTAVPLSIGTAVTIVNDGTGALSLAPAGGVTIVKAGTAGSYTGTLAIAGLITLLKIGTNKWVVSGVGLS